MGSTHTRSNLSDLAIRIDARMCREIEARHSELEWSVRVCLAQPSFEGHPHLFVIGIVDTDVYHDPIYNHGRRTIPYHGEHCQAHARPPRFQ